MSSQPSDLLTHQQRQAERQQRRSAQERVQELLQRCARLLDDGGDDAYVQVATLLADENGVLRTLERLRNKPLEEYTPEENTEGWHWADLDSFISNPDAIRRAARGEGGAQRKNEAQRTVTRVVSTCTRLAECMGAVQDAYEATATVEGWTTKLGTWLQDEEMDVGDPVFGYVENETGFKTLHLGRTNGGKSTGLENEAWDYYRRNFVDGERPCKVIDLVGFRQGENWLLDVPQQQDELRRVREEQDLPPDFEEAGQEAPEIEILHPLVQGFEDRSLPYDTEDEGFTVKPFTIPASEISEPVLVSLIDSRLTQSQESTFRNIYDEVDSEHDDWSLSDLADAVRTRDTLSEKDRDAAVGALRALQRQGFIRTKDCPHTLDWDRVFESTETITVFSQAMCPTKVTKLVTVAYLGDEIFSLRKDMAMPPECTLVMRELWEVAPHSQRQENDKEADAILDAVGNVMEKLVRQNRHIRANITADTQTPGDLLKSVRERFNRYVIYGIDYDTIKDVFGWTLNNRPKQFASTIGPKAGEAGIVGQVQAALDNKNIEFYSPVRMAPPPHHHFDVRVDGTGWHARAEYHDHEELRRPRDVEGVDWSGEVPESLEIKPFAADTNADEPSDPDISPMKAFVEQCLVRESGVNLRKSKVYDAYDAFAEHHDLRSYDFDDHSDLTKFGNRLGKALEGGLEPTMKDGETAYQDLVLTQEANEYMGDDEIELEPASAPIDTSR